MPLHKAGSMSWDGFEDICEAAQRELTGQRTTPAKFLRLREDHPYLLELCERFPKSIRLGQKDKRLPFIIDQLYSCLAWTGRASVVVYTHEAQGKGDLMLGIKTAQTLRRYFPSNEKNAEDIVLFTAKAAVDRQQAVFDDCGLPYVVIPGSEAAPEAHPFKGGRGPEHVIVAPQLAATKNVQVGARTNWKSKSLIALTEYSKHEAAPPGAMGETYATGLDDGEVGITIDYELREYKKDQDKQQDNPKAQRAARLGHLHDLRDTSAHLLLTMLPGSGDMKAKVDAFAADERSRLYFAYSNKSASRFALVVAAALDEGAGDLVHVVQACPEFWKADVKLGASWLKDGLKGALKDHLASLGVGRVELVEFADRDKPTQSVLTSYDIAPSGRTLRWIVTRGVPYATMRSLMRASEPICMMTGNQSTSEALSAGKTILYESIGMAQSWAFFDSLIKGAEILKADADKMAVISRDYDSTGRFDSRNPPTLLEFTAAGKALRSVYEKRQMSRLSDLVTAKDLGRWIGGHYLRRMLLDCPSIAEELQAAESKLYENHKDPQAYVSLVKRLMSLAKG